MSNAVIMKTPICGVCNNYELISLDREAAEKWAAGGLIQECFPTMTAAEREVLITGIHPACWDSLFPEEDSEDEIK